MHTPQVLLTDGDEEMLQLATASARLNAPPLPHGHASSRGSDRVGQGEGESIGGVAQAHAVCGVWTCKLPWGPWPGGLEAVLRDYRAQPAGVCGGGVQSAGVYGGGYRVHPAGVCV